MLSVAVHVGEVTDDGADLVQLYARENGHRARDGVLLRRGREVARSSTAMAGGRSRPPRAGRAREGRSCSPAASRRERREAIERVRPWAVDASSSLETEPGSRITHACARTWRRRGELTYGEYGGRFVPRR
jgi:hypothetical protein